MCKLCLTLLRELISFPRDFSARVEIVGKFRVERGERSWKDGGDGKERNLGYWTLTMTGTNWRHWTYLLTYNCHQVGVLALW